MCVFCLVYSDFLKYFSLFLLQHTLGLTNVDDNNLLKTLSFTFVDKIFILYLKQLSKGKPQFLVDALLYITHM